MKPVVKLIAITQGAGELEGKSGQEVITYNARVSNPKNQSNFDTASGLLKYCIKHGHWSIFEQADMTLEINTTRGIAAQILRHRSFCFQEFCLAGDAKITISSANGVLQRVPIKDLYEKWKNPNFKARFARSYDSELNRFIVAPILSVYSSGEKDVYEYTIQAKDSTRKIKCTREHRVYTKEKGFVPFGEAYDNNLTVALNGEVAEPLPYQMKESYSSAMQISDVHKEKTLGMSAKWGKIKTETYLGVQETFDIEMDHHTHNFVADGIVVHNSQRYADVTLLPNVSVAPDLRSQDTKNRQNSIDDIPEYKKLKLQGEIQEHFAKGQELYNRLVDDGVALECARFVLPLATPTRMYMKGNCRSWIHYLQLRTHESTQKEHRDIAEAAKCIFICQFPDVAKALGWEKTPECPDCEYQSAITIE